MDNTFTGYVFSTFIFFLCTFAQVQTFVSKKQICMLVNYVYNLSK